MVTYVLCGLIPLVVGVFGLVMFIASGFDFDDTPLANILSAIALVCGLIFTFSWVKGLFEDFAKVKNKRKEIELLLDKISEKELELRNTRNEVTDKAKL